MTKLQQAAHKILLTTTDLDVDNIALIRLEVESVLRNLEDAAYIKGYKACLKKQEMARAVDKAIYDPETK